MKTFLLSSCVGLLVAVSLVAAQQQPSEVAVVINGDPGTPPRYAVPDFVALDYAAQRALLLTRLPELPAQFPNPSLTVHVTFQYQR